MKEFVTNNLSDIDRLYDLTRNYFEFIATRIFLITDPLECRVVNFTEFSKSYNNSDRVSFEIPVKNLPSDNCAVRNLTVTNTMYINRYDYLDSESASKHYLTKASPVLLKQLGAVISVVDIKRNL